MGTIIHSVPPADSLGQPVPLPLTCWVPCPPGRYQIEVLLPPPGAVVHCTERLRPRGRRIYTDRWPDRTERGVRGHRASVPLSFVTVDPPADREIQIQIEVVGIGECAGLLVERDDP